MWHRKERRPLKKAVFLVTQSKPRTLLFGGGVVNVISVIREIHGDQESGEELRTGLRNFQNGIRPSVDDSKFQETLTLDSSSRGFTGDRRRLRYCLSSSGRRMVLSVMKWFTCHVSPHLWFWSLVWNCNHWIIYHKWIINCHLLSILLLCCML